MEEREERKYPRRPFIHRFVSSRGKYTINEENKNDKILGEKQELETRKLIIYGTLSEDNLDKPL